MAENKYQYTSSLRTVGIDSPPALKPTVEPGGQLGGVPNTGMQSVNAAYDATNQQFDVIRANQQKVLQSNLQSIEQESQLYEQKKQTSRMQVEAASQPSALAASFDSLQKGIITTAQLRQQEQENKQKQYEASKKAYQDDQAAQANFALNNLSIDLEDIVNAAEGGTTGVAKAQELINKTLANYDLDPQARVEQGNRAFSRLTNLQEGWSSRQWAMIQDAKKDQTEQAALRVELLGKGILSQISVETDQVRRDSLVNEFMQKVNEQGNASNLTPVQISDLQIRSLKVLNDSLGKGTAAQVDIQKRVEDAQNWNTNARELERAHAAGEIDLQQKNEFYNALNQMYNQPYNARGTSEADVQNEFNDSMRRNIASQDLVEQGAIREENKAGVDNADIGLAVINIVEGKGNSLAHYQQLKAKGSTKAAEVVNIYQQYIKDVNEIRSLETQRQSLNKQLTDAQIRMGETRKDGTPVGSQAAVVQAERSLAQNETRMAQIRQDLAPYGLDNGRVSVNALNARMAPTRAKINEQATQPQYENFNQGGGASQASNPKLDKLLNIAKSWNGKDFKPGAFAQCAYFVRAVYNAAGIPVGSGSYGKGSGMAASMAFKDTGREVAYKDAKPGDLIFFANTYNGPKAHKDITHIGIYLGNGMMIDRSTSSKPVRVRGVKTFPKIAAIVRPKALETPVRGRGNTANTSSYRPPSYAGLRLPNGYYIEGGKLYGPGKYQLPLKSTYNSTNPMRVTSANGHSAGRQTRKSAPSNYGYKALAQKPELAKAINNVAYNLKIKPEWLADVIHFESKFSTSVTNSIGATGLIQFMPGTAKGLGTSTAALRRMTITQQMKYVEKYLKGKGQIKNMRELYSSILTGRRNSNLNIRDMNGSLGRHLSNIGKAAGRRYRSEGYTLQDKIEHYAQPVCDKPYSRCTLCSALHASDSEFVPHVTQLETE